MNVGGIPFRTIWLADDKWAVHVIDQRKLPHKFVTARLESLEDAVTAIKDMWVRGAPLIGATAAYGMALAMHADPSDKNLDVAHDNLLATRPTAVNLRWALEYTKDLLGQLSPNLRADEAYRQAAKICDDDVTICSTIGEYGFDIIKN